MDGWDGRLGQQLFFTLIGFKLLCSLFPFFLQLELHCQNHITSCHDPHKVRRMVQCCTNCIKSAMYILYQYSVVNLSHAVHLKIAKKEKRRPSILQSCKLILLLPVLAPPSCRRSASRSCYMRSLELRMTRKQKGWRGHPSAVQTLSKCCPV